MADYAKLTRDFDTGTATVTFGDETSLTAALANFSQEMKDRLALHGLGQKLVDSYASAKKVVEAGEAESEIAYAKECAQEIIDNLTQGIWSSKRAGGPTGPRTSQLAQALAVVTRQPLDVVIAKLATLDEETKKAYAKKPKVQIELMKIRQAAEAARLAKLEAAADDSSDNVEI